MTRVASIIGSAHHGRHMSLDEFYDAEPVDGQLYELGRGTVTVVDVADPAHGNIVEYLIVDFGVFKRANPSVIKSIFGGTGCKVPVESHVSERHPDVAVYNTPRPRVDDVWREWVPAIVIEVVSKSSIYRDYEEKPPEYLAFGVTEYWIVDPIKQQITFNSRVGGLWKPQVLAAGEKYATPGFELDVAAVLAAGA